MIENSCASPTNIVVLVQKSIELLSMAQDCMGKHWITQHSTGLIDT